MPTIKKFGHIQEIIALPPLTDVQVDSFRKALQFDVPASQREDMGLQAAFK
jgi:DNA-directed RNA polymerase subunit beta